MNLILADKAEDFLFGGVTKQCSAAPALILPAPAVNNGS